MSKDRERIDPITAERLISDAQARARNGADPLATGDRLAELLAAAATSARSGERDGEEAAVMAFRDANLAPTPESRRRSMLKTALAKMATAKVAVAVVALGGGGVALAATSGHLPGTSPSSDHPTGRPSTSVTASDHASRSAAAKASSGAEQASNAPSGTPSPNLRGLCTAYNAGVSNSQGKALDNPAFTALITAAGGKDKVAAYCTTVLATKPGNGSGSPTGAESHGSPSSHPSGAPSSHPGDDPSHPSGPSSTPSHPTPTATTHGH